MFSVRITSQMISFQILCQHENKYVEKTGKLKNLDRSLETWYWFTFHLLCIRITFNSNRFSVFYKNCKGICPVVFYRIGDLKNFAKFTGKHLCWSLFFNKVGTFLGNELINDFAGSISYKYKQTTQKSQKQLRKLIPHGCCASLLTYINDPVNCKMYSGLFFDPKFHFVLAWT